VGVVMTREQMDALVVRHFDAEVAADVEAILAGFVEDAEHDVAGRAGPVVRGREGIGGYYQGLLADLRIERFEPVRRWYGDAHVVDESVLHGRAVGCVVGKVGHGRAVHARLLHVFDVADGLISRESAWLDVADVQQQLSNDGWTADG
jgi:SnoaL-like domain